MLSRVDSFKALLSSPDKLAEALADDPSLIREKDEDGMTLLHRAAEMGHLIQYEVAVEMLRVLFNSRGLDFNAKDRRGNTPLHVAALSCENRLTSNYIFPTMVKKATEKGFDFETRGHNGQTVFQMAKERS